MIEWRKCPETMPDDEQECILYSDDADKVGGPIIYDARMRGWVDFFATQEAGYVYRPGDNGPTHWAPWNGPADRGSRRVPCIRNKYGARV
jgi:hypothetical protein